MTPLRFKTRLSVPHYFVIIKKLKDVFVMVRLLGGGYVENLYQLGASPDLWAGAGLETQCLEAL